MAVSGLRRFVRERRRALLTVGAAGVLAVAVATLIGRAADYARVLEVMEQGNKAWFAGCVAGELAAYVGYVLAYRDVARIGGGPLLPYRTVIRVVVASFGATVLGAAAGGLAVDIWALRRAHASGDEALARTIAMRTLEWAVLAVVAALAAAAALAGLVESVEPALALAWLAVTIPAVSLGLAFGSARVAPRVSAWARRRHGLLRLPGRGLADAVGGLVLLRLLVARPLEYRAGLAGYPIRWAGDIFCLWSALQAFGADVSPGALVLAYATGYAASALPLPAGGAGGIDAAMTFALTLVGVPLAPALLAVFAYRAFSFWLELFVAVALLPLLRRLRAELVEAPRQAEAGP